MKAKVTPSFSTDGLWAFSAGLQKPIVRGSAPWPFWRAYKLAEIELEGIKSRKGSNEWIFIEKGDLKYPNFFSFDCPNLASIVRSLTLEFSCKYQIQWLREVGQLNSLICFWPISKNYPCLISGNISSGESCPNYFLWLNFLQQKVQWGSKYSDN